MATVQTSRKGIVGMTKDNRYKGMASELKARVNRSSSTNKTKKKQEVQEPDNGDSKPKQGKRRNPDYTQAGFYIRKDLQRKVKGLLLDEEDIDFSDLINNLLQEWVNKHQSD